MASRKLLVWMLAGVTIALALSVWGPTVFANMMTRSDRYDLHKNSITAIPKQRVGIVFGAGVYQDGTPTPYLQWRIQTAVKLYEAHRVQKLLMSGDNSRKTYDEPLAMQKLAIKLGVKPSDITLDYAGRNTYDSCYRAHAIFGLRNATLVSNGYHLPRAIMTCDGLGVHSIGVAADSQGHRDYTINYIMREWLSTDKAVIQNILKPKPALLGPSVQIK